MATYPTDDDIDNTFPDNTTGDIGADDMRTFQKDMTAAGADYANLKSVTTPVRVFDPTVQYEYRDWILDPSDMTQYRCVIQAPPSPTVDRTKFAVMSAFDEALAVWRAAFTFVGTGGETPGEKQFTTNNVNPDLVTMLRVSRTGHFGSAITILDGVNKGDWWNIAGVPYDITGKSTMIAQHYQIPVVAKVPGRPYTISVGQIATAFMHANLISRIPAGGTTGQTLTKLSDDDFDVGWA